MGQKNSDFDNHIHFEFFFKMHIDPLSIIDTDGHLLKVNEAWSNTLGYNTKELEGKSLIDFIHPDDVPLINKIMDSLKTGNTLLNFTSKYKHKDGEYLLIEWRTNNTNIDKLIYLSACDITHFKVKEEELLRNQQRLEAILETRSNYVVRMDFNQNFSYVNKKYAETFGWLAPNDTLIGKSAALPIHAESIEPLTRLSEKCVQFPNQTFQIEIRHNSNTDLPIYIIWECTGLSDADGNMYEVQGLGIDISERKIAEEIERVKKEAELLEMATPITQLWDGILLLPLVGIVDTQRAQNLTSSVLQKITETQAKVFILDISGVSNVDTAVANYFIKLSKATRLMGCRATISGLSPAIAQTMIELGIQLEDVITTASMKDALEQALSNTGSKLVSIK